MSKYLGYTDEMLMARMKEGNLQAYEALYNRYWHLLFLHACKMLDDEDEAKDVIQEIFTGLWQKRSEIVVHTSVKSYLYRSVRNEILDHISKGKLKKRYMSSLAEHIAQGVNATEDIVLYNELARQIEKGISELPEKMRLIFEMSRHQGISHENISKELDISTNTVKKTINRAIKQIRAQMKTILFTVLH